MIEALLTERLALRLARTDDLDFFVQLNSDPAVMTFLTGRASSADETMRELQASAGDRWLAFARSDSRFLGWVGAFPMSDGGEYSVGWRFARHAWGHGFATEAARALIDHLFSVGARRVIAQTMAVNEPSRAVMERLGLRHLRTLHLVFDDPLPGTELGEVEYELTRPEWERRSVGGVGGVGEA